MLTIPDKKKKNLKRSRGSPLRLHVYGIMIMVIFLFLSVLLEYVDFSVDDVQK